MGQLVFQATAGGQVALVGPNPSTNFSLNVPAVNGNLVTTGDTGTVTNTMLAASAYNTPGAIGSGTANTGAFTTLSASSTVSGTGFSTYLASPPAIGGTTPSTGKFTTITGTLDASISGLTVGKGGGSLTYNTALGVNALAGANTGSNQNTAVGWSALAANTSGNQNAAFGTSSLIVNTTGSNNSAFGQNSLVSNTTGSSNTAVGEYALGANTTASNNTAVGYQAGYSNTTGAYNTLIGMQAGYSSTTVAYVTAVGYGSLYSNTATDNTALGERSLYNNTSGTLNVAIGSGDSVGNPTLYANTTGSYNTAIGNSALGKNTTASNNTAVGYQAGYSNQTGGSNTFIGNTSGYNATASNGFNTFVGASSGYLVTTGYYNTIIGGYNGNQGGLDIRTANNYIVLSDGAGNPRGIFDGSGNYSVGTVSPYAPSAGGVTLTVNGGQSFVDVGHVSGTGSGTRYVGFYYNGSSIGSITQTGTTAVLYNTTSDYRLKNDVTPIATGLSTIQALNPVSFTWVDGRKDDGFLAHELQAVIPNCVTGEKDAINEDGTPKYQQMDNSGVIPFLVKAIQEQQAIIEQLKAKVGL